MLDIMNIVSPHDVAALAVLVFIFAVSSSTSFQSASVFPLLTYDTDEMYLDLWRCGP